VFIADCSNHIRKVLPAGTIDSFPSGVTWAFCTYYYYYYYDNFARAGLAVDAGSNLFVADTENNRVHKVTPAGAISLAGGGFNGPLGVAVDAQGNLFIADQFNHRVQKITAGGIISTVAGTGASGFSGDGGAATLARLFSPSGVAVDVHGNLFIADLNNHRIRRVTPGGIISTVAGNGSNGFSGDGGAATSAQLNYPSSVAVDAVGNLFISDTNNHRIRRVGFAPTVPTLAHLSTSFGAQGMTMNVALGGTSFTGPLTINAGSGITASNVAVVSDILATATFTIDSNATPGSRNVTVTTGLGTSGSLPFNVVLPFPDLSITATRTGNLGVGFEGVLAVNVTNHGTAAATGLTVTDTLPSGLTFVSGSGDGWSCSAEQQAVTCVNPNSLAAGASTGVNLAVAVGAGAISGVSHSLKVAGDGDLVASNDTATAVIVIATPAVNFRLDPPFVAVGGQSTLDLTIPTSFPYDVTGTLTLAFVSNAAIPANDPAIQFATGGRTVTFTIPANTLQARFDASTQAGPIGFQVGTVSGALSFSGVLQTGALQTSFSTQQTVPKTAPAIHSVQDQADGSDLDLAVSFYSTPREVTQLTLRFSTTPAVHLSCGTAPGCLVAGNALVLDVKSVFDTWYAADVLYGSAGSLHIPLTIQGTVKGSLVVSLRNSLGTSNTVSLPLP
jgi:uncharacterized repeat protein (TIGR01451 family)